MNNANPIQKFLDWLFRREPDQLSSQADPLDRSSIQELLRMVETTDEDELSCDEVFALLDQYVEQAVKENGASNLLPLVKKHLDRCGDCHEEYEALMRIIEATGPHDRQDS